MNVEERRAAFEEQSGRRVRYLIPMGWDELLFGAAALFIVGVVAGWFVHAWALSLPDRAAQPEIFAD